MSDTFFHDLDIPKPTHNLEVGSGSHSYQTAAVMQRLEPVLDEIKPDCLLVYGDVNSTVAGALAAAKAFIPVAHVEAGLRSYDRTMPEETNRIVTDHLADTLFAPSLDAVDNLVREGIALEKIHFVGNVMIDSLIHLLPRARGLRVAAGRGLQRGEFILVTLHRPSNVDDPATLRGILSALIELGKVRPVIFPVHPRTRANVDLTVRYDGSRLQLVEPLPYVEMLGLIVDARLVITDSGGVQEETTYLGVPCLTVRPNTERPVTCSQGTNRLVSSERDALLQAANEARAPFQAPVISRWDGRTADRITAVLIDDARFGD